MNGYHMTTEGPKGERFSLLYLRPDEPISDSPRLRMRLQKRFERSVSGTEHPHVGRYLEAELGIKVLHRGVSHPYIHWDAVQKWALRDVLCAVTLIGEHVDSKGQGAAREYKAEVTRIFSEECASYRVDSECGVHPAVDASYQATLASAVRGLHPKSYAAARDYLTRADNSLMPDGDGRDAIRAAFDAVENVFRMMFDGAISLNKSTLQSHLRPLLERLFPDDAARRTALKFHDAFIDWADACHNYRHAAGQPEPAQPPEELTVALVSQGFGYVRWLADLRRRYDLP